MTDRLDPLNEWTRTAPLQLVGAPGIGKSWLARQWADSVGRVVWTSADGVTTAAALRHRLAVQLDVDDARDAVRALEARQPSAWVVDDAEGAAEALSELPMPAVPVLITTRRRLALPGSVVDVGPLSSTASRALFVATARAARHGFDPAASEAAIGAICASLDGVPLAIELAAARVRALTPDQIASRLTLDHLTNRQGRGRHRSLRQALGSAVESVSDDARRTLEVAAVFGGAFTLEALEAVGAGGMDDLEELVDAGLVLRGDGSELRLLGPVRAFAAEQLAASGRGDAAAERVAEWVVAEAERVHPWDDAAVWATWRDQLGHVAARGGALGARAAVALGRREALYGPVGGHRGRCEGLLAEPLPRGLRARLLRTVAEESMVRNDFAHAEVTLEQALEVAEGPERGRALRAQAQLASDRRRATEVPVAQLDEAAVLLAEEPAGAAEVELVRSIAHLRLGQVDEACAAAHQAAERGASAPAHIEAQCLAFLADAERHGGVPVDARLVRLDRALALPVGPPKVRALVATKRAIALADAGRLDEAIASLDGPAQRLEEAGDQLMLAGFRLQQVAFWLARGDRADAARTLEAVPRDLPHYAGVLRALRAGQLAHGRGDVRAAASAYHDVLDSQGDGYGPVRREAEAFLAALEGRRAEGLLDGVIERAHAGPALGDYVDALGRWEARLLARLVRPVVRVASDGRWFQVGAVRHDLGRKTTQIRVLAGLAARAGAAVPLAEVLAFGWPGESPRGDSGRARVHVTVSSLRKAGLQGALWTAPGDDLAYVLDAEVVEATGTP